MTRWVVLVALLLAACAGGPPAPSAPPWALIHGSWAEYRILRGHGTYDAETGCITVDEASLVAGELDRVTNLAYGAGIARVSSAAGVAVTNVPAQLAATLVESNTGQFIGESANYGAKDQSPPEPIITVNPIAGEVLNIDSLITRWDGIQFRFATRYRTLSVVGGVVTTCLVEQPDLPNPGAYTQRFQGGEMVEQVAGMVDDNDGVNVIVGRIVGIGRN